MKTILIIATALLTMAGTASVSAQRTATEADLQALYRQIDEAIDHSQQYATQRQAMIANAQRGLSSDSLPTRLAAAEQLFELYKPYKNDSALYYASLCISIADSLQRKDLVGLCLSRKAYQCSNAGMYVEALDLLKKVDQRALDREGLTMYYTAWMHVSGEIGSFSQQPDERRSYFALQDSYRDSVLAVAEESSEEYLHLKMDVLCARQLYQDALEVSNRWLTKVKDGTHANAYAAFYRSVVYDRLGNNLHVRYWLAKSALDDIRCAVNNQASLFMLAERLCSDGDYERAYRYINFCKECNTTFSPQLRNYQVRYVANVLEAVYKDCQNRYSRLLTVAGIAVLLLLTVIIWLVLRQRRRNPGRA